MTEIPTNTPAAPATPEPGTSQSQLAEVTSIVKKTLMGDTTLTSTDVLSAVKKGLLGEADTNVKTAPITVAVKAVISRGASREDVHQSVRSGLEALISRITPEVNKVKREVAWSARSIDEDNKVNLDGWGGKGSC